MHGSTRLAWLGLTPEPERELPIAVATLRARRVSGGLPSVDDHLGTLVAAETRRIQELILRGSQRTWLRYLGEITALVAEAAAAESHLALRAAETVLDHHRMLIGLPGSGYDRAASQRDALRRIVTELRGGVR